MKKYIIIALCSIFPFSAFSQRKVETDSLKARAAIKIKLSGSWKDVTSFFDKITSDNYVGTSAIKDSSIAPEDLNADVHTLMAGSGGVGRADSLRTDDGVFDADKWLDASGDIDTTNITDTQWQAYIQNHESGGGGASQLSDLSDVGSVSYTDGKILMADGADYDSKTLFLEDIDNVDLSGYNDNDILRYNSGTSKWEAETPSWLEQSAFGDSFAVYSIKDLADVDTSGVQNGSILEYSPSGWVIGVDDTGGGGSAYADSVTHDGRHVPGDSLVTDKEYYDRLASVDSIDIDSGDTSNGTSFEIRLDGTKVFDLDSTIDARIYGDLDAQGMGNGEHSLQGIPPSLELWDRRSGYGSWKWKTNDDSLKYLYQPYGGSYSIKAALVNDIFHIDTLVGFSQQSVYLKTPKFLPGATIIDIAPQLLFNDTDGQDWMIYANSDNLYFQTSGWNVIMKENKIKVDSLLGLSKRIRLLGLSDRADSLTYSSRAVPADSFRTIEDLDANYQPLESTLTDIADGTINEDLDNTANPWADNEVANDITVSNYLLLAAFDDSLTAHNVADGADITNVGVNAPVTGGGASGSITISVDTTDATSTALATQHDIANLGTQGSQEMGFGIIDTVRADDVLGSINMHTNATIDTVIGYTDNGTASIHLEKREKTTPSSSGTAILSSDLVCDTNSEETATFNSNTISMGQYLRVSVSAVGGTPAPSEVWVTVKYTRNE